MKITISQLEDLIYKETKYILKEQLPPPWMTGAGNKEKIQKFVNWLFDKFGEKGAREVALKIKNPYDLFKILPLDQQRKIAIQFYGQLSTPIKNARRSFTKARKYVKNRFKEDTNQDGGRRLVDFLKKGHLFAPRTERAAPQYFKHQKKTITMFKRYLKENPPPGYSSLEGIVGSGAFGVRRQGANLVTKKGVRSIISIFEGQELQIHEIIKEITAFNKYLLRLNKFNSLMNQMLPQSFSMPIIPPKLFRIANKIQIENKKLKEYLDLIISLAIDIERIYNAPLPSFKNIIMGRGQRQSPRLSSKKKNELIKLFSANYLQITHVRNRLGVNIKDFKKAASFYSKEINNFFKKLPQIWNDVAIDDKTKQKIEITIKDFLPIISQAQYLPTGRKEMMEGGFENLAIGAFTGLDVIQAIRLLTGSLGPWTYAMSEVVLNIVFVTVGKWEAAVEFFSPETADKVKRLNKLEKEGFPIKPSGLKPRVTASDIVRQLRTGKLTPRTEPSVDVKYLPKPKEEKEEPEAP